MLDKEPIIIMANINCIEWKIRFLPSEQMREGDNGTCWSLKRIIDIDASLGYQEAKKVLTHELMHALMATQGRSYEEEINNESVCEIVAWNIDKIVSLRDSIMQQKYNKEEV